ncbi:type II toxin-antitoxin system PemK/MazF family toxin [Hanamia caeni]|jgi:mRNA interferase MazF|uniref:mRNA interferase n=1 Tax=Hanamia caeni TaxID=2294116 RepID=A0A3M9NA34_9BACT|nr:type II toxin-antitoxin system PemK/MazF family toxin [Hanamia caeni]RNI34177.1 type II toxin-antitoxin system PemK/MazF family toxin [Hanamia caeni]
MTIKRGFIYFAALDPTQGSEINKTRPVFVISNDINNQYSNTVTIIPITSNTKAVRAFEVFVPRYEGNLPKDSKIKCDQIRTIDKTRILNEVGELSDRFIADIETALRKHLDI